MAKNKIQGNYSINEKGGAVCELYNESAENKRYAGILKCGHCGKRYFLPVVFTATCKNLEAAKEILANTPRVKKDNKGSLIDVFEISEPEFRFINTINYRHDPYLNPAFKELYNETNEFIIGRRIASETCMLIDEERTKGYMGSSAIHTQEDYDKIWNMFEKNFAPIKVGDKLIYPNVNRQQAMRDYYYSNTVRYGIYNNDNYLVALYYLVYGKDNELGVSLDTPYVTFRNPKNPSEKFTRMLAPEIEDKIRELDDKTHKSHLLSYRLKTDSLDDMFKILDNQQLPKQTSQIDKFNARMAKRNKSAVATTVQQAEKE